MRLIGPLGETLQDFTYGDDDPWPGRADGKGSSLEMINPLADPTLPSNWRSSYEYTGTPGTAGIGPQNNVVVNEVLTHTDLPQVDAIELYNTTTSSIDISDWYLSDSSDNLKKYKIPAGTVIGAGQYLVFDESQFDPASPSGGNVAFSLSSEGDDVWLTSVDGAGAFKGFEQHFNVIAAINGESFGRWPNGTGELYPMSSVTLGAANSGPRIGPVAITEVMYNPTGGNPDLEFVEFTNLTNQTIPLSTTYPTVGEVPWKIDGLGFTFPTGTNIAPNGTLVVVHFDPTNPANASLLSAFRTAYGIGPEVQLVGGYTSLLDNSGRTDSIDATRRTGAGNADGRAVRADRRSKLWQCCAVAEFAGPAKRAIAHAAVGHNLWR